MTLHVKQHVNNYLDKVVALRNKNEIKLGSRFYQPITHYSVLSVQALKTSLPIFSVVYRGLQY